MSNINFTAYPAEVQGVLAAAEEFRNHQPRDPMDEIGPFEYGTLQELAAAVDELRKATAPPEPITVYVGFSAAGRTTWISETDPDPILDDAAVWQGTVAFEKRLS